MHHSTIRRGLFLERFLVAFASGLFLSLPLYFRELGRNEVFFAQVYSLGAVGTLGAVAGGVVWLRRWGLARVAPWGCGLFALGSLVYAASALFRGHTALYCLASLLQGTGWGVVFTFGPICLSSVVGDSDRTRLFTEYAACSTLGVGLGPVVASKAHALGVNPVWVFAAGVLFSSAGWWVSRWVSLGNEAYAEVKPNTNASGWSEFKSILRQPSSAFLWMVLLGGCVYTAMINLQTTFAQSVGKPTLTFTWPTVWRWWVRALALVAACRVFQPSWLAWVSSGSWPAPCCCLSGRRFLRCFTSAQRWHWAWRMVCCTR